MSEAIDTAFRARFEAAFPRKGETIRGKGRPQSATITYVANKASFVLKGDARLVAQTDVWAALAVLQSLAYPLTEDEREELLGEDDAAYQNVDPATGHIIQTEHRWMGEFATIEDGKWMLEAVAIPAAKALAKRYGGTQFVRIVRWAASRSHRTGSGETLAGRTALYQHKMYVSDEPSKNANAFGVLCAVHPSGRVEWFTKAPRKPAKARKAPVATQPKAPRKKAPQKPSKALSAAIATVS